MTLALNKSGNYVNPYSTNWNYLHNMAVFQVKLLKEIVWNEKSSYIIAFGSWFMPDAQSNITDAEISVESFIEELDNEIKEL
jgi:hypothetical protein